MTLKMNEEEIRKRMARRNMRSKLIIIIIIIIIIINQQSNSREYTSGFLSDLTADFGVKTSAKLTSHCWCSELPVQSQPDYNFCVNFLTYNLY